MSDKCSTKQLYDAIDVTVEAFKALPVNDPMVNQAMDALLVRLITEVMTEKLSESRDKGRYGWWSDEAISGLDLQKRLSKAVYEHDYESVLNYGAMLLQREGSGLK